MPIAGQITRIEMDFMNSIISLSRAYRDGKKLIQLEVINGHEIFIKKESVLEISKTQRNGKILYHVVTEYNSYPIDKEQGEKLIKEW